MSILDRAVVFAVDFKPRIVGGLSGTSYAFGVFDGLLSPRDIAELDTLVLSGVR